MKKTKAFTLIELLVVISIIALLLSILMPSLKKVKDSSALKVCGSNLRQILLAVHTYAMEDSDRLPHSYTDYGREKPVDLYSPMGRYYSWVCLPIDEAGGYVTGAAVNNESEIRGIEAGTVFPYLNDAKVYKCPTDRRSSDGKGGYRTYSLSQLIAANWVTRNKGVPVYKLGAIRSPSSRLMAIEEGDPRIFNQGSWQIDPAGRSWYDVIAYWHNRGSNIGLADGHVELFQLRDQRSIDYFEMYKDGRETLTSSSPVSDNEDIIEMARKYNNSGTLAQ